MIALSEVTDDVFRLEVPMPPLESVFSVYIIRGAANAVIEPGPAATIPLVQEALSQLGLSDLEYIIPTHLHVDHAGGTGMLARAYPRARVVLHPRGARHAVSPVRLIEGTKAAWGPDYEAGFGPISPVPEIQARTVENGENLGLGARGLQVLYAPGHAPHQIVVLDEKSGGIFCGDAVGVMARSAMDLPLPNTAPPDFDQKVYLDTMEMIRGLSPRMLFYSHGGVVRDPDGMISRAREIAEIFSHLVLEGLRSRQGFEEIKGNVREHIARSYGVELREADLEMPVGGFVVYYSRRGLE